MKRFIYYYGIRLSWLSDQMAKQRVLMREQHDFFIRHVWQEFIERKYRIEKRLNKVSS